MPGSIGRRVHRTVFAISFICLVISGCLIYLANEDMEQTMLTLDYQAERAFLLDNIDRKSVLSWNTADLRALYVPADQVDRISPGPPFQGLSFPYSGEIDVNGDTFLVTIDDAGGGRLYLATNITLFEHQETLFAIILAIICLGVIALSFVLARFSSRRLVVPLQQLAEHIGNTLPGRRMSRVPARFEDVELATIASTFNSFLDELEAYVKREQSLLSLASHELRTPIAVTAGALDVIEKRGRLHADDWRTLKRAQLANAEMSANVNVILKLARHKGNIDQNVAIDMPEIIAEVLAELDSTIDARHRVTLNVHSPPALAADPVWVKMLLRNLIQNALQHTAGKVRMQLEADRMEITDQGSGLPESYRHLLVDRSMPAGETPALSGLGLFIVTLICERLDWQLDIPHHPGQGTTLHLRFNTRG